MDYYQKVKEERSFNLMIYQLFETYFFQQSKKYFSGKLIDIGCGSKPYFEQLKSTVTEHIGVDHELSIHDHSKIDLVGTAYNIPSDDNVFDSALCTAVLEHLEEPELAIRECYRVLKPDGIAIYSVPFIWHIHEEPRDFFRYSTFGLEYLFTKSGFEIIEIKPLSGFIVTFLQLHLYFISGKLNKGLIKNLGIFKAYVFFINRLGLLLNKFDKSYSWTWMYLVTARAIKNKQ
jgi:SAM-dependent methyltransferase